MTIRLTLSESGIRNAQKQLEEYRTLLEQRAQELAKRLAEKGLAVARIRFENAEYAGENDVTVTMEQNGSRAVITAAGKAVAFIEFGTGVAYPGYSRPLPAGVSGHGEYGKGRGANPEGWNYFGTQGSGEQALDGAGVPIPGVYHTRGNPPAQAMWSALAEMAAAIQDTWLEVMG